MFCKRCGKKVPDDSTYCPFCGETLKAWENNIENKPTIDPTDAKNIFNQLTKKDPNVIKIRGKIFNKEKFFKLRPVAKLSRILMFLSYIGLAIFFFGTAGLAIIFSKAKETEKYVPFGYAIVAIVIAYSVALIIASIIHFVRIKKDRDLLGKDYKGIVIVKIIFLIALLLEIVFSILNITTVDNTTELRTAAYLGNIIVSMICCFITVLHASSLRFYAISEKIFKIEESMNKQK